MEAARRALSTSFPTTTVAAAATATAVAESQTRVTRGEAGGLIKRGRGRESGGLHERMEFCKQAGLLVGPAEGRTSMHIGVMSPLPPLCRIHA